MSRVIACPHCGRDRWEGAGPCGSCGHKPVKQARRPAAPAMNAGPRCRRCGDTGEVYSGDQGRRQCPDCAPRPETDLRECEKAPPGWRCTRGDGHDGPCAAVPDAGRRCTWDHAAWCATYRGGSQCDCATWSRREKGGCRCEDCRRWRTENLKPATPDLRGLLREAVEYLTAEADIHAGAEEGYRDFLGRARAALGEVKP